MIALNLSGGGTKIAGHVGACEVLYQYGFTPNIITGVSAGAIASVPIAMGMFTELKKLTLAIQLKDIFNVVPITPNGKLSRYAYFRFLRRKESLGVMGNLQKTMSTIITPSVFSRYKNGSFPTVIIMAVDSATGKRHFFNLKELSYKDYLTVTEASASIPLANPKVRYKGLYLTDGGIRNGIISHWLFKNYPIKKSISIYLRKQDIRNLLPQKWEPTNIESVALRDFAIMQLQTSIADENRERVVAELKGIDNSQIFVPSANDFVFDTNKKNLFLQYQLGKEEAFKYILNNV